MSASRSVLRSLPIRSNLICGYWIPIPSGGKKRDRGAESHRPQDAERFYAVRCEVGGSCRSDSLVLREQFERGVNGVEEDRRGGQREQGRNGA